MSAKKADPAKAASAPGRGRAQGLRTRHPGDLSPEATVARVLRVDHAGAYGARRIYEGRMAVLGRRAVAGSAQRMHHEEPGHLGHHLGHFEKLMVARRVRPTALQPFWHVTGFALGAATAFLDERAAVACTVAVEAAIEEHHAGQLETLGEGEAELKATLEAFRAGERKHHETGLEHGAEAAPAYQVLHAAIKSGARLAIWLSERI